MALLFGRFNPIARVQSVREQIAALATSRKADEYAPGAGIVSRDLCASAPAHRRRRDDSQPSQSVPELFKHLHRGIWDVLESREATPVERGA